MSLLVSVFSRSEVSNCGHCFKSFHHGSVTFTSTIRCSHKLWQDSLLGLLFSRLSTLSTLSTSPYMKRGYMTYSLSSQRYFWPFVVLTSCPSNSGFSTPAVVSAVLVRGEGSLRLLQMLFLLQPRKLLAFFIARMHHGLMFKKCWTWERLKSLLSKYIANFKATCFAEEQSEVPRNFASITWISRAIMCDLFCSVIIHALVWLLWWLSS